MPHSLFSEKMYMRFWQAHLFLIILDRNLFCVWHFELWSLTKVWLKPPVFFLTRIIKVPGVAGRRINISCGYNYLQGALFTKKPYGIFHVYVKFYMCKRVCMCVEMHVYESSIPPMFINPKVDSLEKILLLFRRDKSIVNEWWWTNRRVMWQVTHL